MVRVHPDPPDSPVPRGISSAGRAPALQAGGQRFDPVILHQVLTILIDVTSKKLEASVCLNVCF